MSFLNLSGEKYVCEKCGKTLTVKLERTGEYQIGDMAVFEQKYINEELNFSEAEKDIYYYYHNVLCEDCAKKVRNPYYFDENDNLGILLNRFYAFENEIDELPCHYVEGVLSSLNKEKLMDMIGNVIAKTQNTHDTPKKLLKKRLQLIKTELTDLINNGFEKSEQYIRFKTEMPELIDGIKSEAKKIKQKTILILEDVMEPHNLNPYVEHELTIAVPTEKDKDFNVYTYANGKDFTKNMLDEISEFFEESEEQLKYNINDKTKNKLKDMMKFLSEHGITEEDVLN